MTTFEDIFPINFLIVFKTIIWLYSMCHGFRLIKQDDFDDFVLLLTTFEVSASFWAWWGSVKHGQLHNFLITLNFIVSDGKLGTDLLELAAFRVSLLPFQTLWIIECRNSNRWPLVYRLLQVLLFPWTRFRSPFPHQPFPLPSPKMVTNTRRSFWTGAARDSGSRSLVESTILTLATIALSTLQN